MSIKLNHRKILGKSSYLVSHLSALIPKKNVTSEWLFYYLKTVNMANYCSPSNYPSLAISKITKIPIIVPPLKTQKKDCLRT